ncbi:MAG: hypothetical protein OEZ13_10905 [Spirochaetia bacterium]|nr:hypothetical protein [Spirochaetia bacterium]
MYLRKLQPSFAEKNSSGFVKEKREILKLTQADLALKAGVGLRFVRDLETKNI